MKIALVLDDTLDKTDGVQQAVITTGKWLASEGHEVHYLVAETNRKDLPNIYSLSRFINLRYNRNTVRTPLPAKLKPIKELLAKENYDVVHVMVPYSPFFAKKVVNNLSLKVALVGTFHMLPASKLHSFSNHTLRQMLGKSLERFDKIIAVSEPAVHFARRVYGLDPVFIPNPISIADFRSGRRLKSYQGRKLNLVFLGRLVRRKGILELIKAYNALDNEVAQKTRLIICGKGPLKSKARQLVNPNREVIFTGYVSEEQKPDYLATADIAVFPSTGGEAFGIVLVEAMAAGAGVVIGGANPGYRSVLNEQPYLLFDPSDTKAFSDQLTLFITDSQLRQRMHTWQDKVVEQYDISVVGKQLLDIYKQALHERAEMR